MFNIAYILYIIGEESEMSAIIVIVIIALILAMPGEDKW
jgi:hypothetical protein